MTIAAANARSEVLNVIFGNDMGILFRNWPGSG
jgi:hypothetical protein